MKVIKTIEKLIEKLDFKKEKVRYYASSQFFINPGFNNKEALKLKASGSKKGRSEF